MGLLKRLLVAAAGLTLAVGAAAADTTVKWLHIEVNPGPGEDLGGGGARL